MWKTLTIIITWYIIDIVVLTRKAKQTLINNINFKLILCWQNVTDNLQWLLFSIIKSLIMRFASGRGGMADALGWGPSGRNPVEVQVLSAAPNNLITCGCSLMAKPQPSKLMLWVRFPSPAPIFTKWTLKTEWQYVNVNSNIVTKVTTINLVFMS